MTTPPNASDGADGDRRATAKDTRLDVDTESLFARAMMQRSDSPGRMGTRTTTSSSSSTSTLGPKRRSWWDRVVAFGKRTREEDDDWSVDQDLYMRTILESYSSSLSSNRLSSVYKEHRSSLGGGLPMRSMSRRAFTDESEGVYVAQPETPNADEEVMARVQGHPFDMVRGSEDEEAIMEDEDEKTKRRIQRRITQEAIRAKLLQRNQHRARTRRKFTIFALCIGVTLTAFIGAAMLIANSGTKTREARVQGFINNQTRSSNSTASDEGSRTPTPSTPGSIPSVPTPGIVSPGDGSGPGSNSLLDVDSGSGSSTTPLPGRVNGTLPPLTGRSGLDLITPKPTQSNSPESIPPPGGPGGFTKAKSTSYTVFIYVHCLLMSVSLWMSLVVIGMHMTFRSFRTYSMPLVLELSIVQTGYWITSLLRVQFMDPHVNEKLSIAFCLAECFFNFGQISFTCALAFNMYRSVVSYADVLMDTQSAKRRYRSYTLNVMMLSLLASATLALVGYRTRDDNDVDNMEICLYPTCRLILYVYYPLLAFGFNFIFYMRFKRTIGGAYPMSATGRLNKIARSYLVLFFVCWGCLILLTALGDLHVLPKTAKYVLQCVFDVLGVGTALITLTNFVRCRRAFDFGLSLKAIDPHSIEFEEPLQILGEGTFALVLKAKWHQRSLESSDSRTVDVAVKTFKHTQFETLEEMKEEAYLSSKLVHPCVMMTYGCYTIGNNLYIVSEYLGGGTLQDVIDTTDSMPYERVLRYAHMVAMGMRFLHGLPVPIIHRDLKPLNCIFDSDQEMLKIADFGESRLFRKEGGVVRQKTNFFPSFDLTLQMTTNIGSACWAAPEVLKDEGKSEYSLKVDVYSFGIMCWQLYTCKAPYTDIPGSVLAVAEAVMAGRRPDIPGDCPTLFSKIMRRCWHEDPVRRPNFEDIVQLLEIEMSDLQNPKSPVPTDDSGRPLHKTRSTRRLQLSTPRPGP